MSSAVARGQRYKLRTKQYLEAGGYQVAFLERMHMIQTAKGRIPVKRDQFASDLLAVNGKEIVFVQVKGGVSRRTQLAAARRAFEAFQFPAGTRQWIVLWRPRARMPEVLVVSEGPCGEFHRPPEKVKATRRRRTETDLPLVDAAQ